MAQEVYLSNFKGLGSERVEPRARQTIFIESCKGPKGEQNTKTAYVRKLAKLDGSCRPTVISVGSAKPNAR